MTRFILPVLVGCLFVTPASAASPAATARPEPRFSAAFDRADGWIGADAAYSIALTDDVSLWLFGDTFLGQVRGGKRENAVMVRNTIALQAGATPSPETLAFFHGTTGDGAAPKPDSFFRPRGGANWFWPLHGCRTPKGLFVFLSEIESTGDPSAFGFRQVGMWLARIPNWRTHPTRWRIEYQRIPHCRFDHGGALIFGTSVLAGDEHLFLYGVEEDRRSGKLEKHLVLARVPLANPGGFDSWQFRTRGGWSSDPGAAARLRSEIASEFSITRDRARDRYLLVYSKDGLSPEVRVAEAAEPWGSWSAGVTVYTCPESARDPKVFCYAAKAHPQLASQDGLSMTYVSNSMDFARILADASLYRPMFLTIDPAALHP